jgi:autotransporter-associated beta strand protein
LSGAGTLNENATSGTVSLAGVNTNFTGPITLTTGTLNIGNDNTNPLGTGLLTLNGGSVQASVTAVANPVVNDFVVNTNEVIGGGNNVTFSGNGSLSSGDTLTNTNSGITTLSGVISGQGALIQNNASGTFVLANSGNSYNGTTTITAGTLEVSAPNAVTNTSDVSVASGATFALNNNDTIGSLSGAGNVTVGTAAILATSDNNSTTFRYSHFLRW